MGCFSGSWLSPPLLRYFKEFLLTGRNLPRELGRGVGYETVKFASLAWGWSGALLQKLCSIPCSGANP